MNSLEWVKLQRLANEIRLLQDQIQAADAAGLFALAKTLTAELGVIEQQRESLVDRIYDLVGKEPTRPN